MQKTGSPRADDALPPPGSRLPNTLMYLMLASRNLLDITPMEKPRSCTQLYALFVHMLADGVV
jgi:hypothetical protein